MSAHPGPSFLLRTLFFLPYSALLGRPYRPAVRTPPFHGGNTGSNPVRVAERFSPVQTRDPGAPIVGVTMAQAEVFTEWLSKITHEEWCLPQFPLETALGLPDGTKTVPEPCVTMLKRISCSVHNFCGRQPKSSPVLARLTMIVFDSIRTARSNWDPF